jgi:predicted dehydrogenase
MQTRRQFIHKVGMASMALPVFRQILPAQTFEKKLKVALVGLGRYAGLLADGIEKSEYCELTAIVTGTAAKADSWGKKYKLPKESIYNYENFDKIALNQNIDVVYIVLPNGMHKEYAIRAAKAGKHVIVEKPMAINAAECNEIIAACNNAGVQLAVGYRLHYEPYNMEMMRLGQQNVYGKVQLIEADLGYNTTDIDPSDWHLNPRLSGGGCLQNLGVYCVQGARYIMGQEPVAVTAQYGPKIHPQVFKHVEESMHWTMEFASGAMAKCSCSSAYPIDRLFASAEHDTFELNPAISYGPFKGWTRHHGAFNFQQTDMQQVQMDEMAKVLLMGQKFPEHISGLEGLKDMKVIDAIYKAARTGKRVMIG